MKHEHMKRKGRDSLEMMPDVECQERSKLKRTSESNAKEMVNKPVKAHEMGKQ
jgi:hypothetical protein